MIAQGQGGDELVGRVQEALTPHGDTKAAYMGEFSWTQWLPDENGIEQGHERVVPWDTIKEIMAAIRERAGVEKLDVADCIAALSADRLEASAGRGDVVVVPRETIAAAIVDMPLETFRRWAANGTTYPNAYQSSVDQCFARADRVVAMLAAALSAPDAEGGGVPHKIIEAITALYENDRGNAAAFENAVRGAYVAGRLSALAPTAAGRDAEIERNAIMPRDLAYAFCGKIKQSDKQVVARWVGITLEGPTVTTFERDKAFLRAVVEQGKLDELRHAVASVLPARAALSTTEPAGGEGEVGAGFTGFSYRVDE